MMPSNNHDMELFLLRVVAQRVADCPFNEILDGRARTDGENIWLPTTDPWFCHDDLIGLAAHEGAHVRFKSLFTTSIHESLCPENPAVAHAVLNVLEDARIDMLLQEAYEGFWMDLDRLNHRMLLGSVEKLHSLPVDVLESPRAVDFLINLMCFQLAGKGYLFYHEALRHEGGRFRFACRELGAFWSSVLEAERYLRARPAFEATVVAGTMVIEAMRAFMTRASLSTERDDEALTGKGDPSEHQDPPSPASTGTRVHHARTNASMATQLVTPRNEQAGLSREGLEQHEIDSLECVLEAIRDSGDDVPAMLDLVDDTITARARAMRGIVASAKCLSTRAPEAGRHQFEFYDDDGGGKRKVIVDVIDEVKELREFNTIKDPVHEYERIVSRNRHAILQLQRALQRFQVGARLERGARRGIVCTRDLARVASSKGRFDRPFLSNHEKTGASLLILVDESMSMSEGDIDDSPYDEPCTCPSKDHCQVRLGCDRADECNEAGIWPKEDDGIECPFPCPMEGRSCPVHDDEVQSRICIAKKSAIILAEALKNTRIDFAVIGFSAFGGQHKIVEKIYKDFSEPVNPYKMGSIWVSEASPENRDGTSFLVARRHFRGVQNKHPFMIVISDGEPYHGGTEYVGETAACMTAEAVRALKQTVRMFALSIDKQGGEYLERIYGKGQYTVVNSLTDVSTRLAYLVTLIAGALQV